MLKTNRPATQYASTAAFFPTRKILAIAVYVVFAATMGCTAAMQKKADQSYLSLKKSLIESIQGNKIESITIPADALATKPDSLNKLLHKVGRLAAKDNLDVDILSIEKDRNYLRQGVASGALESGKSIKITMLNIASRADTSIVLK